jgi:hypothetical protein
MNTGHERVSPRAEVSAEALAAVAPLLQPGRHPIPGTAGYAVEAEHVGGGVLNAHVLAPDGRTCVIFSALRSREAADAYWPHWERLYLSLTDDLPGLRAADFAAPRPPSAVPWVSAITLYATPDEAYWIADFERCVAWAWLDSLPPRK